jgi:hypothetical protein
MKKLIRFANTNSVCQCLGKWKTKIFYKNKHKSIRFANVLANQNLFDLPTRQQMKQITLICSTPPRYKCTRYYKV